MSQNARIWKSINWAHLNMYEKVPLYNHNIRSSVELCMSSKLLSAESEVLSELVTAAAAAAML